MCIYHLFIRPFGLIRFLFGARKEKEQEETRKIESSARQQVILPQPAI
jgi:hypothetical protein